MLDRGQKIMIGHAALILLVALVAGICLLVSLVGRLEVAPGQILPPMLPGEPAAWGRTHVGGIRAARRKPDPHASRDRDHASRSSACTIRSRASTSTSWSTITRRPFAIPISI